MNETVYLVLYNILISLSTFLLTLFGYAFKSADTFTFDTFIRQNRARLATGAGLLILTSVLMEVSKEIDAVLLMLGFNTNASPVALGLAVGAAAIAAISKQKRLDGE